MMEQKFHIAFEVRDIATSVTEYTARLGTAPEIVIENEYALWRTSILNFSIRKGQNSGRLRHIGFEDSNTPAFREEADINGVVWEYFTALQQKKEIRELWGK